MSLKVGTIVAGKVSGITGFGAFVNVGMGKTGLVHISEVAREYVKDIHEYLKEGQEVKVMVVSLEPGGKISLSIKRAIEEEEKNKPRQPGEFEWSRRDMEGMSFEDTLNKFKQDSDEKMQAIKRNMESKRGGYRRGAGAY